MEWETLQIKKVTEGKDEVGRTLYDLSLGEPDKEGSSSGFAIADHGVVPKVGDTVDVRIVQGSRVAGVKLNGQTLFDKDEAELERDRIDEAIKTENLQKKKFKEDEFQMDADYEALPEIFRKRIDRLRKNNPKFRWAVEAYDVFACKEAIRIAEVCKSVEGLQRFHDLKPEEQFELGLSRDHSGGTFGQAMQMAHCLIENPKFIPYVHSSLARIAGCPDIGCLPPTEEEKKELGIE